MAWGPFPSHPKLDGMTKVHPQYPTLDTTGKAKKTERVAYKKNHPFLIMFLKG